MDIHELRQFESVYKPSKEVVFCWLGKQYVQLSTEENHAEIVDHANNSLRIWQAAKAQSEKALLEQFEINNKLVEQIEKLKADVPGQITLTHERLQELIAIGVKAALEEQKTK